jgi:hypothetical protein
MPVIKVINTLLVLISADRQRPPSECLSLLRHESVSCARAHWRLGDPPAASRDEPVLWPVAPVPGARSGREAAPRRPGSASDQIRYLAGYATICERIISI